MSGSWPPLSAASNEFSTSSLTVVYRHFPGCAEYNLMSEDYIGHAESFIALISGDDESEKLCIGIHIVEACDVLVLRKELCRALLLQDIGLLRHRSAAH